jgi:hypothetical protein
MTPQLYPRAGSASQLGLHFAGDPHLTDYQMSELLDGAAAKGIDPAGLEAAEAHLHTCAACSAEFANLREALSLFKEASVAHAGREFARLRSLDRPAYPVLPTYRPYSQTLFWVAASAVLVAGILPVEMRWQRTLSAPPTATLSASAHTAESDEALLEDINRELSASVPDPMQALADPTDSSSSTVSQTSTQTPTQRKD